jgi:4'-phosphopantetheinyl transferase EntD
LPRRLRASVTHKDTHAAAVVAVVDADDVHVGIDLECDEGQERGRIDGIARHALTPAEIAHLPVEDDDARRRAVLVRFSAKEALYKAIDKTLRRHVGFHEVGVVVDDERLSFACPQESNLRAEGLVVDVGMAGVVVTLCRAARMVAGAPA